MPAVPGYQPLGSGSPPYNPPGSEFGPWLQAQLELIVGEAETLVADSPPVPRTAVQADLGTLFRLNGQTLTLDAAATLEESWFCFVKGPGTIAVTGGDNIEGESTLELDEGVSAKIRSDGVDFFDALQGGGGDALDPASISGTSTTSLVVELGSKAFTTQAGKAWVLGQRLRAASDDGQIVMEGPVTAYDDETGDLTINVDIVKGESEDSPPTPHADWNISIAGERGLAGADGTDPGVLFNWADFDSPPTAPSSGEIKANSADLSTATELLVSKMNRAGDDISAYLAALDDSTNPSRKGGITLTRSGGNAQATFNVTGITDETGYVRVFVSGHSGAAGFFNADAISFEFARDGDKGADGAGVGDVIGPDGGVVDGEIVVYDSTTGKLIKGSGGATLGDYYTSSQVDSAIASAIAMLGALSIMKGDWDASSGSFPGGGSAEAGWWYIVSVGGTVDGVVFNVGDRIIAITDNASTSTYAANWLKADYTDEVLSVAGKTGAVTLVVADVSGAAPLASPAFTGDVTGSGTLRFGEAFWVGNSDLNNLLTPGFYDGSNLSNAPEGSSDWFYVFVQQHSNGDTHVAQTAWALNASPANAMWIRRRTSGSWGAWARVITTLDLASAADFRAGVAGKVITADGMEDAAELVEVDVTALDWSAFINGFDTNFGSQTIAFPTAVEPGTTRTLLLSTGGDNTQSFASGYVGQTDDFQTPAGNVEVLVTMYAASASKIFVTVLPES